MSFVTLDFETFLIVPGRHAPKPVCLASDVDGYDALHHCGYGNDARDALYRASTPGVMVGANIAFDLAVAVNRWPELVDYVWQAFDEFRVFDVQLAEKLINLAQGKLEYEYDENGKAQKVDYSLAGIVKRRFGHVMDKSTWRLSYGTLYGKQLPEWPEGARQYPLDDLAWTRKVLHEQLQAPPEYLVDVGRQTRAAWWVALMTNRGFALSRERTLKLEADLRAEMDRLLRGDPDGWTAEERLGLVEAGLVDHRGKRETKVAGARLLALNTAAGKTTALTAEGVVQLTKETCKGSKDRLLLDYSRYTELLVTLGKAEALKDAALAGMPIQSRFNTILETGRMSCSGGKAKKAQRGPNRMAYGFQVQNVKREPGLRECFGPRPGYLLGSLDYEQLESCTWAQVCLDLFGFSRMAEMLNAGVDVHSKMGAMIFDLEYEWVVKNKKTDPKAKEARQGGKPFVFGKPGMMGPEGIRGYAHASYGVELTLEQATDYGKLWAKLFSEEKPFFAYIRRCIANGREVKHVRSGRIRGGCTGPSAANALFQGLAADVHKAAMYECSRACYTGRDSGGRRYPALHGSYIVNAVHDEGIFEFPEDRAHEAAHEAAAIKRRVAEEWLPGCTPKIEPCLMREWAKNASAEYEDGRLVAWEAEDDDG